MNDARVQRATILSMSLIGCGGLPAWVPGISFLSPHSRSPHSPYPSTQGDVIEEPTDSIRDMNIAAVDLIVSVGLMGSVIERFPEPVIENFTDKVRGIEQDLRKAAEEIQLFGEAYDGGVDNDDHPDQGDWR